MVSLHVNNVTGLYCMFARLPILRLAAYFIMDEPAQFMTGQHNLV